MLNADKLMRAADGERIRVGERVVAGGVIKHDLCLYYQDFHLSLLRFRVPSADLSIRHFSPFFSLPLFFFFELSDRLKKAS